MNWKTLLCEKRQSKPSTKSDTDLRNEFERDYHRIIGSASFRRLQDKTQVFPLDKSDFVRTRLTHSLEVASFAKSLGQSSFKYILNNKTRYNDEFIPEYDDVEKICSILECAGLIHDIGNPPFGHFGEICIRKWFEDNLHKLSYGNTTVDLCLSEQMKKDLYNFEGNAQALRLLTKLHYLVDEKGMHLTYALLNTIIKYPVNSCSVIKKSQNIKDKKLGYYYAEESLYKEISNCTGAGNCRYPLTYLLEAADDIAYRTADIEDAIKKGYLTYDVLLEELSDNKYINQCADKKEKEKYITIVNLLKEKYEKATNNGVASPKLNAVQNWIIYAQGFLLKCATFGFTKNYNEIMNGTFSQNILKSSYGKALINALSDIAKNHIFQSRHIYKLEISAGTIIDFLMDKFVNAVLYYDTKNELTALNERLISIISRNYINAYYVYSKDKKDEEKLYLRLLLVTDYICGMTDTYAKTLYQELCGII